MSDTEALVAATIAPRRRSNWPLLIGVGLISLFLFLAILGPQLAPKDPRDHALIIQVDGQWQTPPYPAFTPGYPLGSDNLGRDLYSWLLWSVRPTLILVILVAALRLIIGMSIGAAAGWSDRGFARACDGLIGAALAVPALIAALIVITAVGFRLGIWAFVAGLAVTGWAETAQLVREQTRTIKGQEAVEAARALGASSLQTFILHIVPQVMPMMWMLLAFEIANTLVTMAGLGFLGYYLGGAVFAEVDDFVYQRISEMPELGQMLATAWMVLDEPWAMVAAGTVVFLMVLAFNLLGEGLQSRLTRKLGGARPVYLRLAGDVVPWIEDRLVGSLVSIVRSSWARAAAAICLVVLVGGYILRPHLRQLPTDREPESRAAVPAMPLPESDDSAAHPETEATPPFALEPPGGHVWASQWGDPWATRWAAFTGPVTTTVQWMYQIDGSFTGGPVIDAQGTLYLAARPAEGAPGWLYALDPDGVLLWETRLDDLPVGAPALGPDGTVFVADKSGLSSVSGEGRLLWRFTPEDGKPATAGPTVGEDGFVYYKSQSGLLSLTPQGTVRWQAPITETMRVLPSKLSVDGQTVFWGELAFREVDGQPASWKDQEAALTQFVVGADGNQYVQYDVRLAATASMGSEDLPEIEWPAGVGWVFDWREHTWQGSDAGVSASGLPWLLARPSIGGRGLGFYWGTHAGELSSKLNIPQANSIQVIGVDRENVAYICMGFYAAAPSCVAFGPDSDRALWRANFPGNHTLAGAALAPGRLFVATWDGQLIALGDAETPEDEVTGIDHPQSVAGDDSAAGLVLIP